MPVVKLLIYSDVIGYYKLRYDGHYLYDSEIAVSIVMFVSVV